MRIRTFRRAALSFCAAAMLAGCALRQAQGDMPAVGTPGAMPQLRPAHAMPNTSGSALIYSANNVPGSVTIYTYPNGQRVGETSVPGAIGECADSAGDVFAAATTGTETNYNGEIYEFAQASLIATLPDPHWWIGNCAVNPKTGDLAVTGFTSPSDKSGITFYQHATGTPTVLYTSPYYVGSCAYDPAGNLYLSVSYSSGKTGLLRLPAGSKKFELMTTNVTITHPDGVQWADNHLIVPSQQYNPLELYLYELSVKGNTATLVHTTKLHTYKHRDRFLGQVWVQGNTVLANVARGYRNGNIGLWAYPQGGLLRDKIHINAYLVDGLAVAP